MQPTPGLKEDVYLYLSTQCLGRAQAVKASELAKKFDTTLRVINNAVRDLRKDGYLIGSAKEPPFGYYIPTSEAEAKEYLHAFKSELFDMLKTYNRQKRAQHEFINSLKHRDLFPTFLSECSTVPPDLFNALPEVS